MEEQLISEEKEKREKQINDSLKQDAMKMTFKMDFLDEEEVFLKKEEKEEKKTN